MTSLRATFLSAALSLATSLLTPAAIACSDSGAHNLACSDGGWRFCQRHTDCAQGQHCNSRGQCECDSPTGARCSGRSEECGDAGCRCCLMPYPVQYLSDGARVPDASCGEFEFVCTVDATADAGDPSDLGSPADAADGAVADSTSSETVDAAVPDAGVPMQPKGCAVVPSRRGPVGAFSVAIVLLASAFVRRRVARS